MSANGERVVAIDLDGVIIDKPPFIPKKILELLYRGATKKRLSYRYPTTRFERYIRWLSHYPLLRPPITSNVLKVRKLKRDKKFTLYAVSSRYSFLHGRTYKWLKYHKLNDLFDNIFLNDNDEQPHKFKERVLKKIKPDVFIDDDINIVKFLKSKKIGTRIYHVDKGFDKIGSRVKI